LRIASSTSTLSLRLVSILVSKVMFGLDIKYILTISGYAPVTFPGITEAVEAGNFTLAEEWVKKTAAAIRVAGNIIKT
jgi:hypothetical protein